MKVLLIGSGGREHALAYKISQSEKLTKLFCSPGNPGIGNFAELINLSNFEEILEFCKSQQIDLVVVGPEVPLVEGITDILVENNIKVFGPSKEAALLEGDKSFSKNLMKKYNIPTADFEIFNIDEYERVLTYLNEISYPTVIKAFGLAAGKGVLICENIKEAIEAINDIFKNNIFGDSGEKIIIEEFMTGQEASIFAITDGKDYVVLPSAQDHKRIFDGDKGKNTGGMGAYSPAPIITNEILKEVEEKIIKPTLLAMEKEGKLYKGCLYCGLMLTEYGVKVVEFNCRFGDPETQVVLPLLEGDFLELLYSSAIGKIDKNAVKYNDGCSVCVVASSLGYPDNYETGIEIFGIEKQFKNGFVFHAGTKLVDNKIVTSGGRVLGITSIFNKNDLRACKTNAYGILDKIFFDGMFFRKDISDKAFSL